MLNRSRPPSGVQPIPTRSKLTSPSQVPLERLRLTVQRRLMGLLAGDYAGLFPGHGTERGEARPYVPGDDPRQIDWAVTARHHEPHVRDMTADHELDLWLVMDSSSSLDFGTGLSTKHEVGWSVAGAFALLAATGGNRVGGVRSTPIRGRAPELIPARAGSSHLGTLLAALRRNPDQAEIGDLKGAMERVLRSSRRRGMAVVVSDFIGEPDWERPLRSLAQRHEVVAVEVIDPREISLPDVGLVSLVDPETGRRRLLDTRDPGVRRIYEDVSRMRRQAVSQALRRCHTDHLVVRTDRDWVLDFVRFVSGRKARLASAGRSR